MCGQTARLRRRRLTFREEGILSGAEDGGHGTCSGRAHERWKRTFLRFTMTLPSCRAQPPGWRTVSCGAATPTAWSPEPRASRKPGTSAGRRHGPRLGRERKPLLGGRRRQTPPAGEGAQSHPRHWPGSPSRKLRLGAGVGARGAAARRPREMRGTGRGELWLHPEKMREVGRGGTRASGTLTPSDSPSLHLRVSRHRSGCIREGKFRKDLAREGDA